MTETMQVGLEVIDWQEWEKLINHGHFFVSERWVMAMATHPTDRTIQVWATFF